MRRFIGLMSGTSLDGVDGVLVETPGAAGNPVRVSSHVHRPYPDALAAELLALNQPGGDEIHRGSLAANAVARSYADVVRRLLDTTGLSPADVCAIGAHGQTVRHRPQSFDGTGYTVQLLNAALLAELTAIDVVADLRSRDVAAGGQGAPLVPAFHRAVFAAPDETLAVVNIGGISNLSVLSAAGGTLGFDCGPGNALMDGWCRRHTGRPYDAEGAWAASGRPLPALLERLRSEPYFAAPPPKSTGRDLFDDHWLARHLGEASDARAEDVQSTLAELTAWCIATAIDTHAGEARRVLLCGGGAFNRHLAGRIAAALPGREVSTTATAGLPPDQVEAAAFAWLAQAFVDREAGNLPAVTGAAGPRVLGALYPAG